jgi:hypothetical protein
MSKWANRIVGQDNVDPTSLVDNPANWRTHPVSQQQAMDGSLEELGWIQNIIVNKTTGRIVDGHLRAELARKAGEPTVPVVYVELSPEEERKALMLIDPISAMAQADSDRMRDLLATIQTDNKAVQGVLDALHDEHLKSDNLQVPKDAKPNPRKLPIDAIFTLGIYGKDDGEIPAPASCAVYCCIACITGLKYGLQSKNRPCINVMHMQSHKLTFIDNNYFDYNHRQHVGVVQQWKPKYATVMDVITQDQADKSGATRYELKQILDWAEELAQYADNVIIIPKYDCLDGIPEKFVLGYSVPTSHGGTPLPVSAFKGRRVHLLGGSWKAQLAHMAELGDDVVSFDNNYIMKQARFGSYVLPDGRTGSIPDLGIPLMPNPMSLSMAISCSSIVAGVNQLYGKTAVTENPPEFAENRSNGDDDE